MTEQPDKVTSGLSASLTTLTDDAAKLSTSIDRVVAALGRNALPIGPEAKRHANSFYNAVANTKENFRDIDKQFDLLQKLVDTSALLTSSLDLEQVLNGVIDIIVSLTGAERAYLMLRDEATGEFKSRAARNWDRESLAPEEVEVSLGVINIAIEEGTPLVTTNAQIDERLKGHSSIFAKGLRSIVCVPLILRGKTIGVLYADNRMRMGLFSKDIADILTAFANQTAIAIENARLFEQVKRELNEAQQAVQLLRIEVDEHKTDRQLADIIDSDFFQKLREAAQAARDEEDSASDTTLTE